MIFDWQNNLSSSFTYTGDPNESLSVVYGSVAMKMQMFKFAIILSTFRTALPCSPFCLYIFEFALTFALLLIIKSLEYFLGLERWISLRKITTVTSH